LPGKKLRKTLSFFKQECNLLPAFEFFRCWKSITCLHHREVTNKSPAIFARAIQNFMKNADGLFQASSKWSVSATFLATAG
jgi:hypothetical protein